MRIDTQGLEQWDGFHTLRAWQVLEADGRRTQVKTTSEDNACVSMLTPIGGPRSSLLFLGRVAVLILHLNLLYYISLSVNLELFSISLPASADYPTFAGVPRSRTCKRSLCRRTDEIIAGT